MDTDTINHDYLFKELITQFFFDFVEFACPEAMPYLDTSYLEFLQQELYEELFPNQKYIVDVVAKCKFKGQESYFLIHGENQAQSIQEMLERIFNYFGLMYQRLRLPIFPIGVFSYDKPYREERSRLVIGFPWMKVLEFQILVIQLNRMDWRKFLDKPNPVACALMSKMKIAPKDRYKVKFECMRMLITMKLDTRKTRFLSGFIDTYLRLNDEETTKFEAEVKDKLPKEQQEQTMELTTSWKEEGILIGVHQGTSRLLEKQFTKKFGEVSTGIKERVGKLTTAQMEDLGEAIFDFKTLADVEQWLNENLKHQAA